MGKSLSNVLLSILIQLFSANLFKPVAHGGRRRFSGLRVAHGGTPRPRPLIAAVVGAAAAAAAAADSADGDGAVAAAGFDSLLVFFVLGFTALAGDRARRDTRYNACDDRL